MTGKLQRYLIPALLLVLVIVYVILAILSEGTIGGADDLTHYRYARYAYHNPYLFLHHWGKPFFTALTSPFAQLGINGIRFFNVLAGTATAYFTYRVARMLKFNDPILLIFLVISSPMYTVLMLSGMTEILFSLMLILSIFFFYRQHYIWTAILLSFMPFVRNEGVVIIPLFILGFALAKQWRALPFLFLGFVFYSIIGSFYFKDILWVLHEMPYKGDATSIYGSGKLFHYVDSSKYIFGIPMVVLAFIGLISWLADPFLKKERVRQEWVTEMLVIYLPSLVYLAAHSYVWWRGAGNSVGLIRVIAAIIPSAALLGARGWSSLTGLIPIHYRWKQAALVILCIYLAILPHRIYKIPIPLGGTQKLVKEASNWLRSSENFNHKIYYYDPYFCHFMKLNPYNKKRVKAKVYNSKIPEKNIREGEIVIWDAHFSANEGHFPLENIMDNPGFKLIHLVRPVKTFKVLGGYEYEIYIFQRIMKDDGIDNHQIYETLLEDILNADK